MLHFNVDAIEQIPQELVRVVLSVAAELWHHASHDARQRVGRQHFRMASRTARTQSRVNAPIGRAGASKFTQLLPGADALAHIECSNRFSSLITLALRARMSA
jgi:hypothetical protein